VQNDLLCVTPDQISNCTSPRSGDIDPQLLVRHPYPSLRYHEVDLADIVTPLQPRQQSLRIDCTACSGNPDGNSLFSAHYCCSSP
jgi:hypothetical protein